MSRVSVVAWLVAVVCLAFGFLLPGVAGAEHAGNVLLSVDNAAFTPTPTGPLFDTSELVPGRSLGASLGVRSGFGVGTKLTLSLIDVHDDDNGCTPQESIVDTTCGKGQGELGATVVITIDFAPKQAGPYRTVWTGSPDQLVQSVAVDPAMPAKGERWLRITAAVPPDTGNAIQTDSIDFGVRAVLSGNGANGHSDIAGEHTASGGAHHTNSDGVGALAVTGVSVVLFVVGALSLVVAGTAMTFAGISRRRRSEAR